MTDPIPLRVEKTPTAGALLHCPNMIAVASGKGGVGKTWFSITLCHALSKLGKKTLLFDGDFGLANVDIQLGLTPERDLGSVVDGNLPLKAVVTRYADGGFDILAGRSGSGNLAALPAQKLTNLRQDLIVMARNYDSVVVDLGAGIERPVRQMAGPAAIGFVVLIDEPTSLTDAYAFIKLSHAANPSADLRVIVNMANTVSEGRKTYETIRKACQSFLHYEPPLAGIIRRDTKVRDAICAQTPLLTRSPVCDAAKDVEAIAKQLLL
ncbi:MAG: MinD/ParA family protein [Alphaproteobacteria bacterium]|nr:MinD/ParA family protein [Alphaproteobacteria bacterium]